MKAFPAAMVEQLGDRIQGNEMGGVALTPPVDESLRELSRRTAAIGRRFIAANNGSVNGDSVSVVTQKPETQAAELFQLGDLMQYWNPAWKLLRAGVGGAGGGMKGLRGNTYLDGDVLATYPRDEVRGLAITRKAMLGAGAKLLVDVAADGGRTWALDVHLDNERLASKMIEAKGKERQWQTVELDLTPFAGKQVTIRLIQRVLLGPEYAPGNAYWRNLRLE